MDIYTNGNDIQGAWPHQQGMQQGMRQSMQQSIQQYRPQMSLPSVHVMQQRISKVIVVLEALPNMPNGFVDIVAKQLRDVGASCLYRDNQLQEVFSSITQERDAAQISFADCQRLMNNALAERDRARSEIDSMIKMRNQKRGEGENEFERIRQLGLAFERQVAELTEKIRIQEQQLKGKRSLWLNNHPTSASLKQELAPSGAEATGPLRDATIVVAESSNHPAEVLENRHQEAGNQSNIPSGSAAVGQRSSHLENISSSMVIYTPQATIAAEFLEPINEMWKACEELTGTHFSKLNPIESDNKLSTLKDIWAFIMTLTYANRQDAHVHTTTILRDETHRRFLSMRMAVSYIVSNIWVYDIWCEYDHELAKVLRQSMARLVTKGISPQDRAANVGSITNIVQSIVDGENYSSYRVHKLTYHTHELRKYLGPLLNDGGTRAPAAQGIAGLVTQAFDLAVQMHLSHWVFACSFPSCGSRFQYSSMECSTIGNKLSGRHIQEEQYRIRLAVTPVVTIRDDRGVAIRVKQLVSARVLITR